MLNVPYIKQDKFSDGLVTAGSDITLKPESSPDCLNMQSSIAGIISKRLGYAKLGATQAATCNGIYNYRRSITEQYLLGLWGTELRKMDVVTSAWDGTWDTISKDANKGTTLSSNIMYNTAYNGDSIITTEGRDVPQMYDPTDNAAHVDLDWTTSHASVTGDITTYTGSATSKLKITIDTTVFDAIDLTTATSIGAAGVLSVVYLINQVSGFSAKGLAYKNDAGYLVIMSNTRGTTSIVKVEDGTGDNQSTCGDLFNVSVTVGTVTFSGTGTNNMTTGSVGTCATTTNYKVQIDGTGSPNTFKWSDDGGSTWDASTIAINAKEQTLNNDVTITFGTLTGHALSDYWTFTVTVQTYVLSTTISSNIAPSGKYNVVWEGMVMIGNTAANPDRFYRMGLDHTEWNALDYDEIVTPGDVGLTSMATLRGRLYIFKTRSIHRVTYLGGTPLFDIKEVKSTTGTSSPRSIKNVEIPGEGEVIIFLGSDLQLYKFDGYNATPISEPISPYNGSSNYCMIGDDTIYGINSGQLLKCHAQNHTRRHQYILFFPLGDDTTAQDAIVYDYYLGSFYPFHFADTFTVSCMADNGAGQYKLYLGGTNFSYLYDTGNADVTVAINGYWISPRLDAGSEIIAKRFRSVTFTMGSASVTPYYYYRMGWDTDYSDVETMVTSTVLHTYDIPRFGELYQWKISDNSTSASFSIIRASIALEAVGVAK